MIQKDHRFIVIRVNPNVKETHWAVAIVSNPATGLAGHNNLLEVRCDCMLKRRMTIMMRSHPMEEAIAPASPFLNPYTFARHALSFEHQH